ncbi:Enoyl-reductase-domain-containing protein [Haematococcus lacustris]
MAMINTLKQQAATAGTASRRAIVPMVGMCNLPKLTSSTPLSYPAQSWAAPCARRSLASSPQAVAVAAPVAAPAAAQGLSIDLRGKKVFIAGVADDQGFGWAMAKQMAEAGAEISLGVWVPALNIFETNLRRGKLDESRKLSNGSLMEFSHVYPMDAVFDSPEDVPEDIATNKRYAGNSGWTVSECAAKVAKDVGKVDVVVHSLANGPEVKNPLLETSRKGYLAAVSASAYSFVSMVRHFGPHMNPGGAFVNLTYNASNVVIPGYGGGMTSAKAALESDTRVLAYEAGRKWGVRVNSISAGPLGSRAARAIGFIDDMIRYSYENSPIQKELSASEIGSTAAFLVSPLASAITGQVVFVDNGLSIMGLATDSATLQRPPAA